jgi:hypothetical protein
MKTGSMRGMGAPANLLLKEYLAQPGHSGYLDATADEPQAEQYFFGC